MSTFKKTKVVMLPTNEKATVGSIVTRPSDNRMATVNVLTKDDTQPCIHQHLYFLSDEEIKEGDWVCNGTAIWQVKSYYGFQPIAKKIICTTDKSLEVVSKGINPVYEKLPQPSQSFIEKFVDEYNKGNVITEVMVEYHEDIYFQDELQARGKLKINPKDNTITIRKAKDSWSREEVKVILEKAICERDQFLNKSGTLSYNFDKWIEENL